MGSWLAGVFLASGMTTQQAFEWHNTLVVVHVVVALLLVASVPFTKLRHMLTGPLNILVRTERPMGTLSKIEEIETTELLGVGKVGQFRTVALPDTGLWLAFLASALIVVALWSHRRAYKPLVEAMRSAPRGSGS